jgi:hypothetical protein
VPARDNKAHCRSYYERLKSDPERWAAFLAKRADYKRSRRSQVCEPNRVVASGGEPTASGDPAKVVNPVCEPTVGGEPVAVVNPSMEPQADAATPVVCEPIKKPATLQELIDLRVEMGMTPRDAELSAKRALEARQPWLEHPLVKVAQEIFGCTPALLPHRPKPQRGVA